MHTSITTILLAVTDFTITKARSTVITFSSAMDQIYNSVFIPNPSDAFAWDAYLKPLTMYSWYLLAAWIAITSPSLYFLARLT